MSGKTYFKNYKTIYLYKLKKSLKSLTIKWYRDETDAMVIDTIIKKRGNFRKRVEEE